MESIRFKSYPWFMGEMRSGGKNFDIRRFDAEDPRFRALSECELRPWGSQYKVVEVTFVNTDDNSDWATFRYLGMAFCEHLPNWCVLKLGPRVRGSKTHAGGPQ